MSQPAMIRIKLVRSTIGRLASHKACVKGLGLRRVNHEVEVMDTPENRGMINKIEYLLEIQESK